MDLCKAYDVAMFNDKDRDLCECYDNVDCLSPSGEGIDASYTSKISGREIFTKPGVSTCSSDYCDLRPDSWECLTARRYSGKEYVLNTANLSLKTSDTWSSRLECIEFCKKNDVALFDDDDRNTCRCYDANDELGCVVRSQTGGSAGKYIFIKPDLASC
jgi:hypothetical protein